ncbi:MAG: MFS transporter, partial [Burkholderiaceae bacterium]
AMTFAVYSGQWLAVIGFLPVIAAQAGVSDAAVGGLTALAAAVNMVGNVASGRLLQRGVTAPALLNIGFIVMGGAALAAFAGEAGSGASPGLRYFAVLVFSMVGGVIPATLFALAVRLAPSENTLSTTVGWVQQWSAFGQVAGPPLVAWVASQVGGWQWTWLATGACSILGLALVACMGALARR